MKKIDRCRVGACGVDVTLSCGVYVFLRKHPNGEVKATVLGKPITLAPDGCAEMALELVDTAREARNIQERKTWRVYHRPAMAPAGAAWEPRYDGLTEGEARELAAKDSRQQQQIQFCAVDSFAEFPHPALYDTWFFKS